MLYKLKFEIVAMHDLQKNYHTWLQEFAFVYTFAYIFSDFGIISPYCVSSSRLKELIKKVCISTES